MNPAILRDVLHQTVRIGRFQLCELSVLQDQAGDRNILRQIFKNICGRRISCLRLLPSRKLHVPEQDRSQLFRGIDIELLTGLLPDGFLQLVNSAGKGTPEAPELVPPDQDSLLLHMVECEHQRHLNVRKQPEHILFLQTVPDRLHGRQRRSGIQAAEARQRLSGALPVRRAILLFCSPFLPCTATHQKRKIILCKPRQTQETLLSKQLLPRLDKPSRVDRGNPIIYIGARQRIEQIGADRAVKVTALLLLRK